MKIYRWMTSIVALLVLVALVEFPRGAHQKPQHYGTITTPITHFSWASYRSNLADLWHRIAHLDLGEIAGGGVTIWHAIAPMWVRSFSFMLLALFIVLVVGLTKGFFDGLLQWRMPKTVVATGAVQWLLEAIPNFSWILALELVSFLLLWKGIHISFVGTGPFWSFTLVPAVLVALAPSVYLSRMMRLQVQEQLGQQYWVTARSKGLSGAALVLRHVVPNALTALVDSSPVLVSLLFSNVLIVEYLMDKPGIFSTLLQAMGVQGFQPVYWPVDDPAKTFQYQPYDPQQTLAAVVGSIVLFLVLIGLLAIVAWALGYRGIRSHYGGMLHEPESKGKPSVFLTVGASVLGVLVLAGAAITFLQPGYNPNDQTKWDVLHLSGSKMSTPPFGPSWRHLLGTDSRGRDLFVEALHGTLPTIGYVLTLDVVITVLACVLGIATALYHSRIADSLIRLAHGLFSRIPNVIAVLLIVNIPDVMWFDSHFAVGHIRFGIWHQAIYLGTVMLVEVGGVAVSMRAWLQSELRKEYLEAAWISGNTRWSAFWRHLWPAFRLFVSERFVAEFSTLLLMLAALGFLQTPIHQEFLDLKGPPMGAAWIFVPAAEDWAGLIAENARDIIGSPWVVFAPVVFITVTVLAMNLVREGVQRIAASRQG